MGKKITENPIRCFHCGNFAPMEILNEYNRLDGFHDPGKTIPYGKLFRLLSCPSCEDLSLQSESYDDLEEMRYPEDYRVFSETLYPSKPKRISGLPPKVFTAYEAAVKVRSIDTNAFAVLLGRVLEIVLVDRKAKGKTVYDKLKFLADKGEIPEQVAKIAHSLRQLRNVGAHADLGELTEKEVPVLDDLIRAILEYIYSLPKLLDRVQKMIDKF